MPVPSRARDGATPAIDLDSLVVLLVRVAKALLEGGLAADRIERALARIARAFAVPAEILATPTSVTLTIGEATDARTRLVRGEPAAADFRRLLELHRLVGAIERHALDVREALARLDVLDAAPRLYGPFVSVVAASLLAVSSSMLLGAGRVELGLAAAMGVGVGSLEALATGRPALGRLAPVLLATLSSFTAFVAVDAGLPVRPLPLLIAATIWLLPGLTVTTATLELASGHWMAGAGRLLAGGTRLLLLVFGVAVGERLTELGGSNALLGIPPPARIEPWVAYLAPGLAGLAFTVLHRARPRDAGFVVLVGYVAAGSGALGARLLGGPFAGLVGAFAAAVASHLLGRLRDRPAMLMLAPASLLLVPGSVGLLSVSSLLHRDVQGAVETGFEMLLVTTGIAVGFMIATLALPPRATGERTDAVTERA